MSNENYVRNINRRYSIININSRLETYLQKYNKLLIEHKNNIEDAKKNAEFNQNVENIKNEINNFENILDNVNIEIKEKTTYLEQSNNILNYHKNINKDLKEKLKQLQNTNAGAIGTYNGTLEIYKYVTLEYILIILGIIGVIYKIKK